MLDFLLTLTGFQPEQGCYGPSGVVALVCMLSEVDVAIITLSVCMCVRACVRACVRVCV